MKISHDKVSGALYIDLREGEYDHTEDYSEKADVYLDVDAEGNVLGLEALSFEDLVQAIEERGGTLELPDRLAALADQVEDIGESAKRRGGCASGYEEDEAASDEDALSARRQRGDR